MLAAHLQRLARRGAVRYAAMDPAHLQAIQNYLRLALRGADVPHMHQQALPQLEDFYASRPGETARHAYRQLNQRPDPAHLAAYLDLIHEHHGGVGLEPLLQGLMSLVHPVHQLTQNPGGAVQAYGSEALRGASQHVADAYRTGGDQSAYHLIDHLHRLAGSSANFMTRPLFNMLFDAHMMTADPSRRSGLSAGSGSLLPIQGLNQMYDTTSGIEHAHTRPDPDISAFWDEVAGGARRAVSRTLREHVLPHLAAQGGV